MINPEGDHPKPSAGSFGTTILANDLLGDNVQRKKSMGLNEEYAKIVDVVIRYSIHYPMIKFTCKKVKNNK